MTRGAGNGKQHPALLSGDPEGLPLLDDQARATSDADRIARLENLVLTLNSKLDHLAALNDRGAVGRPRGSADHPNPLTQLSESLAFVSQLQAAAAKQQADNFQLIMNAKAGFETSAREQIARVSAEAEKKIRAFERAQKIEAEELGDDEPNGTERLLSATAALIEQVGPDVARGVLGKLLGGPRPAAPSAPAASAALPAGVRLSSPSAPDLDGEGDGDDLPPLMEVK